MPAPYHWDFVSITPQLEAAKQAGSDFSLKLTARAARHVIAATRAASA